MFVAAVGAVAAAVVGGPPGGLAVAGGALAAAGVRDAAAMVSGTGSAVGAVAAAVAAGAAAMAPYRNDAAGIAAEDGPTVAAVEAAGDRSARLGWYFG